jgi:hypothetical protein
VNSAPSSLIDSKRRIVTSSNCSPTKIQALKWQKKLFVVQEDKMNVLEIPDIFFLVE